MKNFLFTSLSFLIWSLTLLLPATVRCQEVTWTSSNPEILSVNSTGLIKVEKLPSNTTLITVTAKVEQNGKTVTSTKTIQVDPLCSTSTKVGECCTYNNLQYCAVSVGGRIWMDRNIGATSLGGDGVVVPVWSSCPPGWRLPSAAEFLTAARTTTGNNSLGYNTNRRSVSTASMARAPLYFHSAAGCPHIQVSSGFYNWGAACPGTQVFYRSRDGNYTDQYIRCVK